MKQTYLDDKIKYKCNGCGVCKELCPVDAITMIEDSEGFMYPKIDEEKCIKCGKCRRVCSNYPEENKYTIKAFATINKNQEERNNSTSGGMFKILAQYVLNNGGIVFGVKFDDNLKVIHSYTNDIKECQKFSGSKYVRSDLKDSYAKVKEFLSDGRYVLFSGTPCQVQGLREYLNKKDNDKLILCEIVCHANPSPKVLDLYIKNLEKIHNKKVKKIYFRSKNPDMNNGAYVEFFDGTKAEISTYIKSFTGEQLINRPSCNKCVFVNENRKADFTIGDFWGIDEVIPGFDDKKGISLFTVNTEKANKIFDKIKNKMIYKQVELSSAFKYNHNSNLPPNRKRKKFFDGISTNKINENNIIEYMKKYNKRPLYKKVINKLFK